MEMVHGRVISLDQAAQLGVLQSAEALCRDSNDQPWNALMPIDMPVNSADADSEACMPDSGAISLHRVLHHLKEGSLHRALGVLEDQPIPAEKLESAKRSTNPHLAHMARFAETLNGFKH